MRLGQQTATAFSALFLPCGTTFPLSYVYYLCKPAAWEFLPTLLLLLLCAGLLLAAHKDRLAPVSKPELLVLGVSFVTCCESLLLMGHDGTYGFGRYKYIVFLLVV